MRITFFVSYTLYASIFLETPFWRRFGKTYHVSFTQNMIHPLRNEPLLLYIYNNRPQNPICVSLFSYRIRFTPLEGSRCRIAGKSMRLPLEGASANSYLYALFMVLVFVYKVTKTKRITQENLCLSFQNFSQVFNASERCRNFVL